MKNKTVYNELVSKKMLEVAHEQGWSSMYAVEFGGMSAGLFSLAVKLAPIAGHHYLHTPQLFARS